MKGINKITIIFSILLWFLQPSLFSQDVYKMTVAQDSSGDYTTIQAAIDASKSFPDQRITIFVKNGTYMEKIVVPACNTRLSIIGENAEKTIITWNDYFAKMKRGRNSTFYAEYGNTSPGADVSKRVDWSHQLTEKEAKKYIISNILSPVLPLEKPVEEWIYGKN